MHRKKFLICAGTRPEAIKLAPVIQKLSCEKKFHLLVCSTGQHKEMLHAAFSNFDITPDVDLDVMKKGQSLAGLTARLYEKLSALFLKESPDCVIVHGDTTSAMVAGMCAFYNKISIAHVEAGLRSHNIHQPFPEELNRKIVGLVTNIHFAPTKQAAENLIYEGVDRKNILITGNTVIDALLWTLENTKFTNFPKKIQQALDQGKRLVLITGHRRENFGQGFKSICSAIKTLAKKCPNTLFVYPVHLNPHVQKTVFATLGRTPNILLTPPLEYKTFVHLLQKVYVILTDSGGIQEEASILGKPILLMREVTERTEGLDSGLTKLVGTDEQLIVSSVFDFLTDRNKYKVTAKHNTLYGDGHASERIVQFLKNYFL